MKKRKKNRDVKENPKPHFAFPCKKCGKTCGKPVKNWKGEPYDRLGTSLRQFG